MQEEEKKASQAATAAAAGDGVIEGLDDGMTGMTAAQQAQQAALKRSKAVKERAVAAAKQKQKVIMDTRRMPMVRDVLLIQQAVSCCSVECLTDILVKRTSVTLGYFHRLRCSSSFPLETK